MEVGLLLIIMKAVMANSMELLKLCPAEVVKNVFVHCKVY